MTLAEFWTLCNQHDWYHAYSDDITVDRKGEKEGKRLAALAEEHGEAFQQMLKGFAEHYFTGEPWGNEQRPKPAKPE